MKWEKFSKTIHENGDSTIVYRAEGCAPIIESRKRSIPHANGVGFWRHTTYFVIFPNGTEKECWKLEYAKEVAEKWHQ